MPSVQLVSRVTTIVFQTNVLSVRTDQQSFLKISNYLWWPNCDHQTRSVIFFRLFGCRQQINCFFLYPLSQILWHPSCPPIPSFLSLICPSLPDQEDEAKVKEEEEPAPLTQLAHSSTLEQEVCHKLSLSLCGLLSVLKNVWVVLKRNYTCFTAFLSLLKHVLTCIKLTVTWESWKELLWTFS